MYFFVFYFNYYPNGFYIVGVLISVNYFYYKYDNADINVIFLFSINVIH